MKITNTVTLTSVILELPETSINQLIRPPLNTKVHAGLHKSNDGKHDLAEKG